MTNPRVLVVAPRLDIGGTEVHLARVLPKLRQAGLDVSLFTIARGGRLEPDFIAAGVPVLGIEVAGPRLLRGLRAAHVLRQEIRRLRPDILQFFLPEPSLIGSLAAAGLASPLRNHEPPVAIALPAQSSVSRVARSADQSFDEQPDRQF